MNKKRMLTGLAVWALSVALTLLIFFIAISDRSNVRIAGLCFILAAETITLGAFLALDYLSKKSEAVMLNAGTYAILGIYGFLTLVASIAFMVANKSVKWLVLADSALLIVFAIILILLLYTSRSMDEKNRALHKTMGENKRVELMLQQLLEGYTGTAHKAKLTKVYEAAKYSDRTYFGETDAQIESLIPALKDALQTQGEQANKLMDQILALYKTRAEQAKASKNGGF